MKINTIEDFKDLKIFTADEYFNNISSDKLPLNDINMCKAWLYAVTCIDEIEADGQMLTDLDFHYEHMIKKYIPWIGDLNEVLCQFVEDEGLLIDYVEAIRKYSLYINHLDKIDGDSKLFMRLVLENVVCNLNTLQKLIRDNYNSSDLYEKIDELITAENAL